MYKIDLLDKKIIIILLSNGRADYADIARSTGISTEKAFYRVNRLVERGIINSFKANIDYKKIEYSQYTIFLKMHYMNYDLREKYKKSLRENPYTLWVGTCIGEYDFRVHIVCKDYLELKKALDILVLDIGQNLKEEIVLQRIRKVNSENFSTFNYLSTENEINELRKTEALISHTKRTKEKNLDGKDWKIIYELCKNARQPFSKISKATSISAEDIKYRYKKILESGILSFSISADYSKLGLMWFNLIFRTYNKKDHTKIIEYAIKHPQSVNIIESVSGQWDFDITFFSKDIDDADKYVMELRQKFYDNISDYKMIIVKDASKNPQVADGIFEDMLKDKMIPTKKINR